MSFERQPYSDGQALRPNYCELVECLAVLGFLVAPRLLVPFSARH